jgi:hypothetical protein
MYLRYERKKRPFYRVGEPPLKVILEIAVRLLPHELPKSLVRVA